MFSCISFELDILLIQLSFMMKSSYKTYMYIHVANLNITENF